MSTDSSVDQASQPWRLVAFASLCLAAALPILQFSLIFPLTSDMPIWDQWGEVELWLRHYTHKPVLPLLLRPYNGHFNIVPKFIFYGLGLLTHWNVRVEVVASYVVCAGALALLIGMAKETSPRLLVVAAALSAYVFSLSQFENFFSGYPLMQNLSLFASVLSIVYLTRRDDRANRFVPALLAAGVASLSFSAANAVWIVGVFAIATVPIQRRFRLSVWSLAGVGGLILARLAASAATLRVNWARVVPFFFVLLGRPFCLSPGSSFGTLEAIGFGVLTAFCLALTIAWRRGHVDRNSLRRWGCIGLLAIGSAAVIALARASAGLEQARASHYCTSTTPLGVSVLMLVVAAIDAEPARKGSGPGYRLLAIVAIGVLTTAQVMKISAGQLRIVRQYSTINDRNVDALINGTATDAQIRSSLYPRPQAVREALGVLREYHLAALRNSPSIDRPVGSVDVINGIAFRRQPVFLGTGRMVEIRGWAADSPHSGAPLERVDLVVDGRLVASARLGLARPDVAANYHDPRFQHAGWQIVLPVAALPRSGVHELRVRIRCRYGSRRDLEIGQLVSDEAGVRVVGTPSEVVPTVPVH